MLNYFSYAEFELIISRLEWTNLDCMKDIAEIRLLLEDAYAARYITLYQWRVLWEDISTIHGKCALLQPDAWRRPVVEGSSNTYIPPAPHTFRPFVSAEKKS
jgi:hypothetical protein